MPIRLRPDIERIEEYRPGRAMGAVAAEYGLETVVKLASNESPEPPVPEVQAAIAAAASGLNRYPDNARPDLTRALAAFHGVPAERVWCGGASNELTMIAALAVTHSGSSAVYAWPSFSLYQIATRTGFGSDIAVPLDAAHRHDLGAMLAAVRADTSAVFVCNPNNPTGTHVAGDDLERFIAAIPEDVLVLVDEAYAEFATASDYRTMIPLAVTRDNVMVTRTFSKAYGLAGLRIGYAITAPGSIAAFRRIQLPFTVNSLGEVAATEALRHQDRVRERVTRNTTAVGYLLRELRALDLEVADSQTNFVYTRVGERHEAIVEALLRAGYIVRPVPPAGWVRVTAGTPQENAGFVAALRKALSTEL
ncbi:MAG TPA: histidinol-phosphate transaminase [Acidimicrobiia bacterium]|nr:histidinol-phosphate transaminase [Acidimicrobiia bacterium]